MRVIADSIYDSNSTLNQKESEVIHGNPSNPKHGNRERIILFSSVALIILAVCIALVLFISRASSSVFRQVKAGGYTGTEEEFLASLAGENANSYNPASGQSSFELAQAKGYNKSFSEWEKTISGSNDGNNGTSMYARACKTGFTGSLSEWLSSLVDDPEKLGHSSSGQKTEYELACDYGFQGSFTDWLVSLID